jgi:hypothetical protein
MEGGAIHSYNENHMTGVIKVEQSEYQTPASHGGPCEAVGGVYYECVTDNGGDLSNQVDCTSIREILVCYRSSKPACLQALEQKPAYEKPAVSLVFRSKHKHNAGCIQRPSGSLTVWLTDSLSVPVAVRFRRHADDALEDAREIENVLVREHLRDFFHRPVRVEQQPLGF